MSIDTLQSPSATPGPDNGPSTSGGFVAGTLIHTRQGLRPLGQLRVGDEVELVSEQASPCFNPITRVIHKADEPVVLLEFISEDELTSGELIVHPDQLFWVAEKGWTAVNRLSYGMAIKRPGKADATVMRILDLFATEEAQVAYNFDQTDFTGPTIDLRDQAVRIFYEGIPNDAVTSGEIEPFTTVVICIEVAGADHILAGAMGMLAQIGKA
jgi:hypothetical protein